MVSGRPADLGFNTVNQISLLAGSLAELKKMHVALKGRKDVAELRAVSHGNAVSVYFRLRMQPLPGFTVVQILKKTT